MGRRKAITKKASKPRRNRSSASSADDHVEREPPRVLAYALVKVGIAQWERRVYDVTDLVPVERGQAQPKGIAIGQIETALERPRR